MNQNTPLPVLPGSRCFACGPRNPNGLHMKFYVVDNEIHSPVNLNTTATGWQNMAHGGIIATVLDEVMAWSVIYSLRRFVVTRFMNLRYVKPVPVETDLLVKGWMGEHKSQNICSAYGRIEDKCGVCLARSEAEIVLINEEKLVHSDAEYLAEMRQLFKQFESLSE